MRFFENIASETFDGDRGSDEKKEEETGSPEHFGPGSPGHHSAVNGTKSNVEVSSNS